MDSDAPLNPYRIFAADATPFAGRKTALARLHQQLADTDHAEGILYVGRRYVGKTTLLRQLRATFDESVVGVYVPMEENRVENETDWLLTLARSITSEVLHRGFTMSRLHDLTPPEGDPRDWFANRFLREILGVIRPHRRLVLLLDDADCLLDAMTAGRLPEDTFAFLHEMARQFPQLEIALTLDSDRESDLLRLRPLVNLSNVQRLTNLAPDETTWLLQQPVAGLYRVPDNTVAAIHRATGGTPMLVQVFGDALYRRWHMEPDVNVMTTDDVKALSPQVYNLAEETLGDHWKALTPNERATLLAISRLLYEDPLRKIDPAAIAAWLVETEYPLDITSINSALRRLEYDELVSSTPSGVTLTAGLWQTWLLENGRLTERRVLSSPDESRGLVSRRVQVLILAAVVVMIALVVMVSLQVLPRPDVEQQPDPTITLVGSD